MIRDTDPAKDWPEDFSHENGMYYCRCGHCKSLFVGYKRRVVCRQCSEQINAGAKPGEKLLSYKLIPTTRRLTFDITYQHDRVIYKGDDDGEYYRFIASNGYEVISRSRMDIQTERLWLLGAKHNEEMRSGTMIFSSNEKRDAAEREFIKAIDEWAEHNGGFAEQY